MATKTNSKETSVDIIEIERGVIDVCILGKTPILLNAMSKKVREELLLPRGRLNAAEKKSNLKHSPMKEFRDAMYYARNQQSPTRIIVKSTGFKLGIMGAAVDIPGATKAQMGRLTWVEGDETAIYGIPQLHMSVVRSADINRTPDVRTRAIIEKWACKLTISFAMPIMKESVVISLLAAAGLMQGVGDWRAQKGSGNFGQYVICSPDDPEFQSIVKSGGKTAQDAAIKDPQCFDSETEEMIAWYDVEAKRRGFKAVA